LKALVSVGASGRTSDKASWERLSKKLPRRNWREIRENWFGFPLPALSDRTPIDSSIGELPDVRRLADLAKTTRLQQSEASEILGLRASIFAEALDLLHRSFHVLASSSVQSENGFCTWSASSSYQSAFFSMRSILRLLGIVDFTVNGAHFILDCWAGEERRSKRGLGDFRSTVLSTVRIEHRQQWLILQRLLRVSKDAPWPPDIVGVLVDCNETDFARRRNALHYGKAQWPGPDLHNSIITSGFGEFGSERALRLSDPDRADFTSVLSVTLAQMAFALVDDLARDVPALNEDVASVQQWISRYRWPELV
jgi:hypothetical protein